jgi:hypothetical protein
MLAIKVQCVCGQRFAFDVEPVNGRMPQSVKCPSCGADGTLAANQSIAETLAGQAVPPAPVIQAAAPLPPPPAAVTAPRLQVAAVAPAPASAPAAPAPLKVGPAGREQEWGPGGEGDTWKWWYYVLAGICIGGYDIWKTYDTGRLKYLGGLFLSVILIAIGIWDFQRKRKLRRR